MIRTGSAGWRVTELGSLLRKHINTAAKAKVGGFSEPEMRAKTRVEETISHRR